MNKNTKVMISFIIIFILTGASFFAGGYIKERQIYQNRKQDCQTLILYAIDKVDSEDLSDEDVMESLVSNIYAAYLYCDNPTLSKQLHDLWNTLIFEDDFHIENKDNLLKQLQNIIMIIQAE